MLKYCIVGPKLGLHGKIAKLKLKTSKTYKSTENKAFSRHALAHYKVLGVAGHM